MNFGKALEVLKNGGKVAREGWNGKGMYLTLIPAGNAMFQGYPMQNCIGMKTANNLMQPGWLASQADMLAEDWELVGEPNEPPLTLSTETFEIEDMSLTLETLEKHAQDQLAKGLSLSLLIDMPGFDEPELITNPPVNIAKKMDYIRATYDGNCNHKHAPGIRIIAYAL
ncbi:MAG: DUF2829 domain-containing protein [Kurthia sp.]